MSEKQYLPGQRPMSFKDAWLQAEAEQILADAVEAGQEMTFTDAIRKALSNLRERAEKPESGFDAQLAETTISELRASLAEKEAECTKLGIEVDHLRNAFSAVPRPYEGLSDEAREYMLNVEQEMLQAGLHKTPAHWHLAMLHAMQTRFTKPGYVPSNGLKVKTEWMQ